MNREEKRQKILIVDDEPLNRALFRSILKEYDISEARNGLEGLEMVRQINPDLILMDIMMPEMDGIEATERLKQDPGTNRIPVIIISAIQETDIRIKALQSGGNDFILKPIFAEELLIRVRNLLKVNNHLQSRWLEEWAPKRGPHVSRDPLPFFRGLLDTSRIF
jgi:CheY-like chemotaxis protein